MNVQHDIAIIGGGPVGAALALALRGSQLKVCVLEVPANAANNDARALALSYGSRLLLDRLGIWNALHALGNTGAEDALPELEAYVGADDPILEEAAAWALSRILGRAQ